LSFLCGDVMAIDREALRECESTSWEQKKPAALLLSRLRIAIEFLVSDANPTHTHARRIREFHPRFHEVTDANNQCDLGCGLQSP
jgi:hypothetical protein